MPSGVKLVGSVDPYFKDFVLTPGALDFVVHLHKTFHSRRLKLLQDRSERQKEWDRGKKPFFLPSTKDIRTSHWRVASVPHDLEDRRVEITGPVDRKMMINALNCGAKVFMADLEDSCSPRWANILSGHDNLNRAVRRTIDFVNEDGKAYTLKEKTATLMVRPRGWHLIEKNLLVGDEPVSASLFDFAVFFFNNAQEQLARGTGPYFYLPKLENHLEARLWADVFREGETYLNVPRGSIRATVLIETITAAFEMEEILWELKDFVIGLNAGRWDYIFSMIKKFGRRAEQILPDRQQISMTVPFMRAYTELLVKSCHRRGAHAIGGMAAFIPNRRDPDVTEKAIAAVRQDKEREANDGFDGTWIAHPDLLPVAMEAFNRTLGDRPHQKHRMRDEVCVDEEDLLNTKIQGSFVSEEGVRTNVSVALQYLNKWLEGLGAVAINNLMEDAATAEISRAQLWQWLTHKCTLNNGKTFTKELYQSVRSDELSRLKKEGGTHRYDDATKLLDDLVLANDFTEFLTLSAYHYLDHKF